jgi:hypothetical protein
MMIRCLMTSKPSGYGRATCRVVLGHLARKSFTGGGTVMCLLPDPLTEKEGTVTGFNCQVIHGAT